MPFQLRKDAQGWFNRLSKKTKTSVAFQTDFDIWYFCFIAGLMNNKKPEFKVDATMAELVRDYPADYSGRGRLIVAALLSQEIKQERISLQDRMALHDKIRDLVDSSSSPWLSKQGMELANRYASGGIDVLMELDADQKPESLETFLQSYLRHVDDWASPPG